jgi:hypothetical protein
MVNQQAALVWNAAESKTASKIKTGRTKICKKNKSITA